jgi:hypothetical protein
MEEGGAARSFQRKISAGFWVLFFSIQPSVFLSSKRSRGPRHRAGRGRTPFGRVRRIPDTRERPPRVRVPAIGIGRRLHPSCPVRSQGWDLLDRCSRARLCAVELPLALGSPCGSCGHFATRAWIHQAVSRSQPRPFAGIRSVAECAGESLSIEGTEGSRVFFRLSKDGRSEPRA